jgi:hypothetical protein
MARTLLGANAALPEVHPRGGDADSLCKEHVSREDLPGALLGRGFWPI